MDCFCLRVAIEDSAGAKIPSRANSSDRCSAVKRGVAGLRVRGTERHGGLCRRFARSRCLISSAAEHPPAHPATRGRHPFDGSHLCSSLSLLKIPRVSRSRRFLAAGANIPLRPRAREKLRSRCQARIALSQAGSVRPVFIRDQDVVHVSTLIRACRNVFEMFDHWVRLEMPAHLGRRFPAPVAAANT